MVPPLRYRAAIVKALLVPDFRLIRRLEPLAIRRRPEGLLVNHY